MHLNKDPKTIEQIAEVLLYFRVCFEYTPKRLVVLGDEYPIFKIAEYDTESNLILRKGFKDGNLSVSIQIFLEDADSRLKLYY